MVHRHGCALGVAARYGISTTHRVLHGALLDAQLLADVYLELSGGSQSSLLLQVETATAAATAGHYLTARPAPLARPLLAEEQAAHAALIDAMGQGAIWHRYIERVSSAA